MGGVRGVGDLMKLPLVVELLAQCPSLPGRQLSQVLLAFTQAQPLQKPDLLHLQHTIVHSSREAYTWLECLSNGSNLYSNASNPF